jgi:hypothetical protein
MEFFSNSKPNLLSRNIKAKFKSISNNSSPNNFTINDNVTDSIMFFLKKYIEPNKVLLILILLLTIYLYNKYENKKKRQRKKKDGTKEPFVSNELAKLNEAISNQTSHLPINHQGTMNPLYPVSNQHSDVNYLADPIPVKINNKFHIARPDDLYGKPEQYPNMIDPQYDYFSPYVNKSRNIYTGVTNTYINQPDTNIANPLGLDNNFVSTDANFVTGMTKANLNNFKTFKYEQKQNENKLIDNMKFGPSYLNPDSPEPMMEPPYSDQINIF